MNGLVSEGSGENVFHRAQRRAVYAAAGELGAVRNYARQRADDGAAPGIPVIEQQIPRETPVHLGRGVLYGTAAEVTPIRSIDRIVIGDGKPGEITKTIADEFFGIATGLKPDRSAG